MGSHIALRLRQRYGLHVTGELLDKIREQIRTGSRATCIKLIEGTDMSLWKIWVRKMNVLIIISVPDDDTINFVTALPPNAFELRAEMEEKIRKAGRQVVLECDWA